MQTEFEIKVLEIDQTDIAKRLEALGFTAKPRQEFKRYVYNLENANSWVRLRTDGTKTALTYKSFEKDAIDGVQELEVEVSDFEKTNELLELLGYKASTYQENNRQVYQLDTIEISVDEWPKIPAYLEIEAKDQKTVEEYIEKLGLGSAKTTSAPTSEVYKLYGLSLDDYPHLTFSEL